MDSTSYFSFKDPERKKELDGKLMLCVLEEHARNTKRVREMQRGTYVSEGCLRVSHGWTQTKRNDRDRKKKNVEEVRR